MLQILHKNPVSCDVRSVKPGQKRLTFALSDPHQPMLEAKRCVWFAHQVLVVFDSRSRAFWRMSPLLQPILGYQDGVPG